MTAIYVSGSGYTVRNINGCVIARGLTLSEWETMRNAANQSALRAALLACL